ncbi:hypothetical protein NT6N_13320 [Oceaniferula spumae]|uniref:PEP-CTERM protein-sorting domain-containing protein n=1 Tax=Oceaniferula spumae TaxID=2979115 RepID=A0AAT9FK33_9BACT
MILKLLPPITLAISMASAQGGTTIYAIDFDSVTTGSVNASTLSAAGTGTTTAAWYLNPGRGAAYTIENDNSGNGDKALLADDTNGGNANKQQFTGINFDNTFDLTSLDASGSLNVSITTATRRNGNNKNLQFQLANSTGSIGFLLAWSNNGTVAVNGTTFSPASAATNFENVNPWNSTSDQVFDLNVSIANDSSFTGNFGGVAFTGNLANSVTDIDRIQLYSGGSAGGNKGAYLSNITVTAIPEPSSSALLALTGLGFIHRRRR